MNFLVLTPDGVGSTYLQRALTVYLNASGPDYYNTHELLNGVELDFNGNLYKKMKGYSQSLSEICELLKSNKAKIISRLAQYRIDGRLAGRNPLPPKGIKINPANFNVFAIFILNLYQFCICSFVFEFYFVSDN